MTLAPRMKLTSDEAAALIEIGILAVKVYAESEDCRMEKHLKHSGAANLRRDEARRNLSREVDRLPRKLFNRLALTK